MTPSLAGFIVGGAAVALPCVLILRSRGSLFVKARRIFKLAFWIGVTAGVMYAATSTGLVHP